MAFGNISDQLAQHQAQTRYNNGPDLSQYPGASASDFKWNTDTGNWDIDPSSHPGMLYISTPGETKDGKTGWVSAQDRTNGMGLGKLALLGGGLVGGGILASMLAPAAAGAAAIPNIGVTTGLPSMAGVGTGVGALSVPGVAASALLPSSAIATGAVSLPAAGASHMGIISSLLNSVTGGKGLTGLATNVAKNYGGNLVKSLLNPNTLNAAGTGLAGVASTEAHNRGAKLDAMMAADQMKMINDQNQIAENPQLLKQFQVADFLKNGGIPATPKPTYSITGRQLPQFNFGPAPTSAATKQIASTMEDQVANRIKNPIQLSDYASQMNPSDTETALNWLSPALTTMGANGGVGSFLQNLLTKTPSYGTITDPAGNLPQQIQPFQPIISKLPQDNSNQGNG